MHGAVMSESSPCRFAGLARKAARFSAAIYLAGLLCSAATGVGRASNSGAMGTVHKWTGHALVVVTWVSIPLSVGVVLARNFRRSAWIALAQAVVLAALIGITMLAAITGYLGPSRGDPSEETINRFVVLHKVALPFIAAVLAVGWIWFFRPTSDGGTVASPESNLPQGPDGFDSNPYAASQVSATDFAPYRPFWSVIRKGLYLGIASGAAMTVVLFGSMALLVINGDMPGGRFHWGMLAVAAVTMAIFTAVSTPLWLGGMALMTWRQRRRRR